MDTEAALRSSPIHIILLRQQILRAHEIRRVPLLTAPGLDGKGTEHMPEKIVIALGGNALQSKNSAPTAEGQLEVVRQTSEYLAQISQRGYEMAVVHGNGPQVGRILLASETAREVVPAMPFDVCGAMSQGYIGYHIQQSLKYALNKRNRNIPVVTLATQVVVDRADPAFQNPSKPIGPFYTQEEARQLEQEAGYTLREDAGRGWRRVVPSPQPRRIVEIAAVKLLWDHAIVITCGGGGIPVAAACCPRWRPPCALYGPIPARKPSSPAWTKPSTPWTAKPAPSSPLRK